MNFLISTAPVDRLAPPPRAFVQRLDDARFGPSETPRANGSILIATLLIATIIRIPGMFTDYWLDEVWSHSIASQLTRWSDLLLTDAARIDNNHPLITAWMMLIGQTKNVWLYRLPSLIAGVGATWMAWRIALRAGGRSNAILATAILAIAFPFALYSSEARGYSLAIFFSLAAFDVLTVAIDRFQHEESAMGPIVLFNLACLLGPLSHLTFIPFLGAMAFWSVLAVRRRTKRLDKQLIRLASLFALPIGSTLALHHWFISRLVIGGAAPTDPLWTIVQSISLTLGGPMSGVAAIAMALSVATLFVTALIHFARNGHGERVMFHLLAVVVMPCGLLAYDLLLSARPQPLMPRYFLVPMAIASLAVARGASLARHNRIHQAVVALLAVFVVASNVMHWIDFAEHGRGKSSAALSRIINNAHERGEIRVGADNSFRVGSVIAFDQSIANELKAIRFVDSKGESYSWWIGTRPGATTPDGFKLDSTYGAGELSGTSWFLYRR